MPDYFPQVQMPTGMAEEAIRLRSQQGAPWAQLAQSLGQTFQGVMDARAAQQKTNFNPEQIAAAQQNFPQQVNLGPKYPGIAQGQPAPAGYQGAVYQGQKSLGNIFPSGVPESLLEKMNAIKEKELLFNLIHPAIGQEAWDKMTPEVQKKLTDVGVGSQTRMDPKTLATINKPSSGMGGAMSQESKMEIAKDFASGKLPPAEQQKILGRTSGNDRADIYLMAKKLNPQLNVSEMSKSFHEGMSEASGIGHVKGEKGQIIGAASASMGDMLDALKPLVPKISPEKWKILNHAFQAGETQLNDPELSEALVYVNSLKGFYSTLIAGGAGTLESDKKAQETISPYLDKGAFAGLEKGLKAEAASRIGRIKETQKPIKATTGMEGKKDPAKMTKEELLKALSE